MSNEESSQTNTEDVLYDNSGEQAQGKEEVETTNAMEGEESGSEESKSEASEDTKEESQEEIEYKLELSENSQLAKEKLDEIAEFSKKHGLSNEAAQEILKGQETLLNEFTEGLRQRHEAQVDAWEEEVRNDPQLGGDNLAKNLERGKRAIEAFGSEAFIEGLKETGYGNHPEVIRTFAKIGELVDNDELVLPGKSGVTKSAADVLYGNNN